MVAGSSPAGRAEKGGEAENQRAPALPNEALEAELGAVLGRLHGRSYEPPTVKLSLHGDVGRSREWLARVLATVGAP